MLIKLMEGRTLHHVYVNKIILMYTLIILHFYSSIVAAVAKFLQLCPILCDPIDGSPPGCAFSGILLARTLE